MTDARTDEPGDGPDRPADAPAFTAVLTRPLSGVSRLPGNGHGHADTLGTDLAQAGIATFDFPLLEIADVADDGPLRAALASLDRYALVVFVSPNAVDHAFARYAAIWPHALPVGVVGPGSVAALARHGVEAPAFSVICPSVAADESARFDSEALYASLEAALGERAFEGRRVLIVRGDGGREWLADRLREAGAEVETVAAYRRLVPEPPIGAWARVHALLAGEPHAWLVTSSEGVRNLVELGEAHLTADELVRLKRASLVAPHPRIAEIARGLGFDSITVSGAGAARIVDTMRSLAASTVSPVSTVPAASVVQPASSTPAPSRAHSRMTDSNASTNPATPASQPAATGSTPPPTPPNVPFTPYEAQAKQRGISGPLLWFVVVVIACAAGVGGFALNRKVIRLDQQLTQRQQANDAQTADLRVKTDQAVATVHQMDSQISQLEGKLADAQTTQQALQQQYADLARNRDDWTLAEVGQMLSSASEQLQLTGNTQLALFALQSADTRLAASDGAQVLAVRKAIAQDIDKLKAAPSTDLTGLAIKLDNAIDHVDTLPLSGEAPIAHATPHATTPADTAKVAAATGEPRWKVWWREFSAGVGQQLTSLVQVRRLDNADAMLVSPDQGYFIRENLKLRLLSARLALLSRNQTTLKSDLHAADTALARYFDASSKETQTVRDLVKDVDAASAAVALPNLDTSLQAVHQYRSRG
ncbi:fused uroporphyrinogen-III synthase HemD/membrane protein HemX [Paraburkholderia sp.]|uniref:fused uroporphyrinogen-III synthase HemD/membrane protein HemX n=1 Tax=Paraburkholderia sp. TaxID=1926495 RepID=UPI003D6F68C0